MPEPKRKPTEKVESDLGLEGFETFFDGAGKEKVPVDAATVPGEQVSSVQIEKLIDRFSQLITLTVDQRVETATIANQLIENQRQLIATQQILIRLMEKSIELTRHITAIEEKLPALFEIPRTVEALRVRVAQLEGVETD
jgi:outer membrane PBP1 activator LpoA protein